MESPGRVPARETRDLLPALRSGSHVERDCGGQVAAETLIRQMLLSPMREEGALREVAINAGGDEESRWNVSGTTGMRLPTQLGHSRQGTPTLSASLFVTKTLRLLLCG